MDAIKAFVFKDTLKSSLIGQFVHLAVIISLACIFPGTALNGWWRNALSGEIWNWYFVSLSFVSGLILIVPAGGILIGKATKRFMDEIGEDNIAGLKKGGQYIGWLERFLVLLLLLIKQPTGIGFLIAAKSILRFGEIRDASQRKVAEYIIIGTFLSFGWALSISVLTQNAIQHWMPTSTPEPLPMKVTIEKSPSVATNGDTGNKTTEANTNNNDDNTNTNNDGDNNGNDDKTSPPATTIESKTDWWQKNAPRRMKRHHSGPMRSWYSISGFCRCLMRPIESEQR